MGKTHRVDDPYTGEIYCEVPLVDAVAAASQVERAVIAEQAWSHTHMATRVDLCASFLTEFEKRSEQIARDISGMMGKPLSQARGEVRTMVARVQAMMELAPEALADVKLPHKAGFARRIVHEPVGVVFVVAPWNYPLLTAVNSIVPAVLAGNAVVVKHSSRTPLCADHFANAFAAAGAVDLVSALHADHDTTAAVIRHPAVGYVAFTGSVPAGHTIYSQAAERFIDVGLELGGKDPAYVAADANIAFAAENLMDGAFYNAGQSCCGIERIYVHEDVYEPFLAAALPHVQGHRLGDPSSEDTTMGPLAQAGTAEFLQGQVREAVDMGARVLCGGEPTQVGGKGRFFTPALVADCHHGMGIMTEESFGPVVAVASVASDDEAVERMNDSAFGLTASVWTSNTDRANRIGRKVQTGTFYMNRCDFLDPLLAWTGVKDSGKGVSLSKLGFAALTRPKSYHLRLQID